MNLFQIKRIAAVSGMIFTVCAIILSSCKKNDFSIPESATNTDPAGIHATMTIKKFKETFGVPAFNSYLPVMLDSDVIISGVINADDHSGNFYKILSLQDSTGGIQIKVGSSYLWQDYPIGRRIFIKTKGLLIFNYTGTYELGGYIDSTTSSAGYPNVGPIVIDKAPNYIIKGKYGLDVPILHQTVAQLNFADYQNLQSMLVQLDDMEFGAFDTTQTYADAITKANVDRLIYDCGHHSVTVRSSGFADFANMKPSKGHGSLRGIYTYYSVRGTAQIAIRDTSDVMLTSPRTCN